MDRRADRGAKCADGVRVVVGPEAHHDHARELAQVAQQLDALGGGVAGDRCRLAEVEAVQVTGQVRLGADGKRVAVHEHQRALVTVPGGSLRRHPRQH